MAVTIKQVAAAAGVSRGTVDRVLHNRGSVKPEVEKHIRKTAEKMGYFPNRAGKILAGRKQPITIGYVMPSIGNLFFDDIKIGIHAAEREMQDFGVTVKIKEVRGFNVAEHIAAIDEITAEGISALCISSIDVREIRECINEIVMSGTPVIAINNDFSDTKRLCYVGSDYIAAGRTAAGLLLLCRSHETEQVLICTGSLNVKGHNERICGFNDVMHEKNVNYNVVGIFETQDDDETAYVEAKKMLALHPEVTLVYITAAGVQGVCRAIEEEKRQERMRVICFDTNKHVRKYAAKGIIDYVICQEPEEQGYQSVKKLFNYFVDGAKGNMKDYITKAVIKINENMKST
ncbi:MAG: LacI family DNA-binding transcriptional regulator [Christensenella sp.]